MKKCMAVILCIGCLLSLFAGCGSSDHDSKWEKYQASDEDEDETELKNDEPNDDGDFEWEYTGSGVEITRYTGERTDVVIPETLDGKRVYSLGYAFRGNIEITSIVIPESVTELDIRWFLDCESLERIEALGCEEINDYNMTAGVVVELPSVKELHLPKLSMWHGTLYNENFPSLEYLSIPSAEFVTNFKDEETKYGELFYRIEHWPPNLKEVVVEENLFASTGYITLFLPNDPDSGVDYDQIGVLIAESKLLEGYGGLNSDKDIEEYRNKYTEITDENAAYVYCNFFRKDKIIVNGEIYKIE